MEHSNDAEEIQLEIIEKTPSNTLEEPLLLYSQSTAMESYVKIPFILIGVFFLIHNVFLAGRSYAYDTYEMIKTVELSIVGIIVLTVFIMAGIAMSKNHKLKKKLIEISHQYHIDIIKVQEEFNALAIHLYGGRGCVIKKK
ncbi:hypothetical protein GCM10022393_34300 [Aquimarina addita]|uniref:Uncharacterized protein n=1 Tax=Aquimarina addita TaxID=870485 RepID=A0ABP6UQK0_9FLAO